jgi:hypothetical protein
MVSSPRDSTPIQPQNPIESGELAHRRREIWPPAPLYGRSTAPAGRLADGACRCTRLTPASPSPPPRSMHIPCGQSRVALWLVSVHQPQIEAPPSLVGSRIRVSPRGWLPHHRRRWCYCHSLRTPTRTTRPKHRPKIIVRRGGALVAMGEAPPPRHRCHG